MEEVVAIKPWFARMPVHSGHGDVERLARGGERYFEFSAPIAVIENLFQGALERLSDRHGLIVGKEAVAVEFDENPIRPPAHADVRTAPAVQAGEIQRVVLGQRTVIKTRYRQSPKAAPPVENERTGKNHWQHHRDTDAQVGS